MTQFDFYLLNLSFRAPEGLTLDNLKNSIEQLAQDCEFIRQHEETIYRHESIYGERLWSEYNIIDALYTPEVELVLGRDHHYMLQVIIDHSKETVLDNVDVLELLEEHTADLVSGLLCLYEVEEVNEVYCIYTRNDWYDFHRYFLGIYPVREEWFASRCTIFFPKLHFHQDLETTLKSTEGGGLSNFSKQIVKCLSHLNDDFQNCLIPNNIPMSLRRFSTLTGVETSNEGDMSRRKQLSFAFENSDGEPETIYCEPHMKLSASDLPGDNTYHYNRIYFHPGLPRIAEGRVLIGHIGKHL